MCFELKLKQARPRTDPLENMRIILCLLTIHLQRCTAELAQSRQLETLITKHISQMRACIDDSGNPHVTGAMAVSSEASPWAGSSGAQAVLEREQGGGC